MQLSKLPFFSIRLMTFPVRRDILDRASVSDIGRIHLRNKNIQLRRRFKNVLDC